MKKFVIMTSVMFFLASILFFIPRSSYAINPQPEPPITKSKITVNESYVGTIIKIDGKRVTVRDEKGVDKIVTGNFNFSNLKVGSKVKVTTRDGLTWLNPQPEPPMPAKTKPVGK